jgi:hypothetical protein
MLRRREQLEVDAEHDGKSRILRAEKASSGGTRGGLSRRERGESLALLLIKGDERGSVPMHSHIGYFLYQITGWHNMDGSRLACNLFIRTENAEPRLLHAPPPTLDLHVKRARSMILGSI